jgi:hypothetical protein
MPNPLSRHSVGDFLNRTGGRTVSPRLERVVRDEIDQIQGYGLTQAAHVQTVEYVSFNALRAVESLTALETQALQRTPLGDSRYKAIVDTATGVLARLVDETGHA